MVKQDVFESSLANNVFKQKYSMDGQELWEDTTSRLVDNVCRPLPSAEQQELYGFILARKFIPGGRYLRSVGRAYHQICNCFALKAEDTREGWGELFNKVAICGMSGGGIGVNYSNLRPSGTILKRTGGEASGPLALINAVNDIGIGIRNGGDRRIALYASLNWDHGDIWKFVDLKNHSDKLKKLKEDDLAFSLPMELTNISVAYDTAFFKAMSNRSKEAKAIWDYNMKQACMTAEPGFEFNFCKDSENARNAPVVGDTYVLTSDGYKQIYDLLGGKCTVWTGKQWAPTEFKKTREQDKTVTVRLTGRKEITCSRDHPFVLADGTKVEAAKLEVGQEIMTSLAIPEGKVSNSNAYMLGCIYGDGYFSKRVPRAELALCGNKEALLSRILDSAIKPTSYNKDMRGILRVYYGNNELFNNRSKDTFPYEVFNWTVESRLNFLAGLLDTDGNDYAKSVRLSSKHYDFLLNVGRLAESLGFTARINKGSAGGYIGTPTWMLLLNGKLSTIPVSRLSLYDCELSRFKVIDIEESGLADVYCCDVGVEEHSFQAEGVIISNCTEFITESDGDSCNLGSVFISHCENREEFARVVELATKFLICGGIYTHFPSDYFKEVGRKNNRIGLGLGGVHEWLLQRGQGYKFNQELHKWMRTYQSESDNSAYITAKELNVAVPRAKRAIAPTGSIGLLAESSTGIEPLFCKSYKRRYRRNGEWVYEYVVDPIVKRLQGAGVNIECIQDSYDIDFKDRVKFQADMQQYVDMGISSTCNLPSWGNEKNNEETLKEYSKILLKYAKKLRGFTIYPDGARIGQPLVRVPLEEALRNEGTVFEERMVECKGGFCGM